MPDSVLDQLLSAFGGPWIDRAKQQTADDIAAYQQGGLKALMANTQGGQELAGGFGGNIKSVGQGIRAYHGSPYDFDKFDLSKIGTGEGAQVKGHGFYFAENEAVAREYEKNLARRKGAVTVNDNPVSEEELSKILGSSTLPAMSHISAKNALSATDWDIGKAIALLDRQAGLAEPHSVRDYAAAATYLRGLENKFAPPQGHMYEVNINAKPEQFLDWEKTLNEQPHINTEAVGYPGGNITGSDYYNAVGRNLGYSRFTGGPIVSETMREAGIPGIKYLDQGSRGAGQGTSNYVVFNPDIVDILRKYGLAGTLPALMAQDYNQQQTP